MAREFSILALAKGQHRYVFLYDDASRHALIQVLRKFVADPQLNFTEEDALALTDRAGLIPRALWERMRITCSTDGPGH